MTLFDECISALGKYATVVQRGNADGILDDFDKNFSFTTWGRIDWSKISEKRFASSIDEVVTILKERNKNPLNGLYVIGCDATLPLIKSRIDKVIEYFDDVEAVSPWMWLFCQIDGWVVEIDDDGSIMVGFV